MPSNKEFAFVAPGAVGYDRNHAAAAHVAVLDREAGLVGVHESGRKKIAICGFASSSRHRMPLKDPEWLICGLNQLYRHIERADIWFDIHCNWDVEADNVPGTDHPVWLAQCGIPVFMIDLPKPPYDLPTVCRYPIEAMIRKHGLDYFTSTVAFMIAWSIDAIERSVQMRAAAEGLSGWADFRRLFGEYTIGIFGIDLIVGGEYFYQKACVEFWLGVAEGLGIRVALPPETALLKQLYRYGYEREPGGMQFLTQAELAARAASLNARKNKLMAELYAIDGAVQESQYLGSVWDLRSKGGTIPLEMAPTT